MLLVVQAVTVFGVVPEIAGGLPLPAGTSLFALLAATRGSCILTNDRRRRCSAGRCCR